jgi:hypothetical protein
MVPNWPSPICLEHGLRLNDEATGGKQLGSHALNWKCRERLSLDSTQELIKTGEPTNAELIEKAQSTSRASQHDPPPHQDPPAQPLNTLAVPPGDLGCYLLGGLENHQPAYRGNDDDPFSSNTAHRGGGNPPDPYGDPWAENQNDRNDNGGQGGARLEGNPPEFFKGDRSKTMDFLVAFKRFMIMNRDSAIARDPYKKCAYFMGCIRGQKTQGWVQRNYDWLDQVETDPEELYGRSPWAILEEDFKWSFVDYAQQEKAHDDLQKLKMTGGNIDKYISEFQMLGHQAHMDLDDPAALWLFARGLPHSLADACIDLDGPESFEQWRNSTQRQHRAWLKKQALHRDYNKLPAPKPQVPNQGCWQGLWNNNRGRGMQAPHPQLQRRDPNTMDTSAGKATMKEQKAKFRKEGCCYERERQGHMAWDCPSKKTKAHGAKTEEEKQKIVKELTAWSVKDMITCTAKFSEEERTTFIQGLQDDEEAIDDPGFLEAWANWP